MYFGNEWLIIYISFTLSSGYDLTKMKCKYVCDLVLPKWKLVRNWSKMIDSGKKFFVYVYVQPLVPTLLTHMYRTWYKLHWDAMFPTGIFTCLRVVRGAHIFLCKDSLTISIPSNIMRSASITHIINYSSLQVTRPRYYWQHGSYTSD